MRRRTISLLDVPVGKRTAYVPGSESAFKAVVIGGSVTDSKTAETPVNEYFRTIVDTTPDCVQIISPAGILLFTNTQGLALMGASSAEAIVGK